MRTGNKSRRTILSVVLAMLIMATSLTGIGVGIALDLSGSVAYNPMTASTDPFKYAPTFTMATTAEFGTSHDKWEFVEITFDKATDFAATDYVAVTLKMQGAAGLTMGLLEGGDRYNNCNDNKDMYFMNKDGSLVALDVLYSACTLANGTEGVLLMPIANMQWQWNNEGSDLKGVNRWYFTANSLYNRDYAITIGEIGVYRGEPTAAGTPYEVLLDVSKGEKRNKYYTDAANNNVCLFLPSFAGKVEEQAPAFAYPFRTDEEEILVNGAHWYGPALGDSSMNWQTLSVKFDKATVDMTDAAYLVIEYYAKAGAPGLTYGLNNGGARFGTTETDGAYFGMAVGAAEATKLGGIMYDAVNVAQGFTGALVLPLSHMSWQFGATADRSLAAIDTLTITTNSQYNWAYEIVVGEVGYLNKAGAYVSLLDLAEENATDKEGKYYITADGANKGTLEYWKAERKMQGKSTIDFEVKNRPAESFDIWTGGSYGATAIVQDSYGDNAVQMKATGTNASGDAYTAITLANLGGWSWEGMNGVSFWARNDSDTEVSFNLETDCRVGKIADRFNIQQGHRFFLYDVNTGKTSIYMTRPCATLPVGFEGWVFIPFTAFARAAWSNNGVTEFMGEGSMVSYLAITIHAGTYMDKAFSVNKFGGYTDVPSFVSTYVKAENTIPGLLELNKEEA